MSRIVMRGTITGIGCVALATLLCLPVVARAQSAGTSFDPGANGLVYTVAVQNGKILVGGTFTMLGGGGTGTTIRKRIGRLNADGSLDTTFDPGTNSDVYAIAVQADGKILVGGAFTALGGGGTGTTARSRIGRLNADGSLDTSFDAGANGAVFALTVQPNGQILVGGSFTSLGGGGTGTSTRNHIGRLNADGSLDTTFDPGTNSDVYAIAVQADGKILVGGAFTALGGTGVAMTTRNRIGRLDTDGSLDASFDAAANNTVFALAVQPDGKISAGGDFTALGVGTGQTPRSHFGRFNPDGSLDGLDPGANQSVYTLTVQADGSILVGGFFTTLGGAGTTPRNYIARFNADGSLDTNFDPGANDAVNALAIQLDGKILVGGDFSTLGGGQTGTTTLHNLGRLNADGSLDAPVDTAPTITTQPQSQTIGSGQTATLSVGVAGATPLAYQWYQGSSPALANPITGATASTYTTPALTSTTNYWVRVSNAHGTADSNSATIAIVAVPPTITTQPQSQTIASGQTATVSVGATGNPAYQWYQGSSGTTTTPIGGATASSYTTPALTSTTSYWVRVSNADGTADSNTATVTIGTPPITTPPPTITTQPQSSPIPAGQTATLSVGATGAGLTYQWYQGSSPNATNLIAKATTSSYTTPALTSTTSYWVRVSNQYGTADSNTATITVVAAGTPIGTPPTITMQPLSQAISAGQTATLSVGATGAPLTYEWYQESGTTTTLIATATASSYTTPALTSTTSYWVRVSNKGGSADSNTATITVVGAGTPPSGPPPTTTPPTITTQPQSQTIPAGQTAVLSVGATGSANLTYQWYQGPSGTITTLIAGATASSFTTPALTTATSYWVRVSNDGMTADSNTATIKTAMAAVLHDLDGDFKTDLAVFRPGNGTWYVRYSSLGYASAFQWGLPGDVPISGDFDGDGKIELTVYRPSTGEWWIRYSSKGYSVALSDRYQWGLAGDIPLATDFDGDGKTDLAVWRPSNGTWYILLSSTGFNTAVTHQWGLWGDIPIAADFDGDGKTELTVWRPSNGTWYILLSSTGFNTAVAHQWGLSGDIPIAADFDGDGKTELTVWRPSNGTWYIRYSDQSQPYDVQTAGVYQWGLSGDVPIVSDFDGDGKAEVAVYRPLTGEWWLRYSSLGYSAGAAGWYQWGLAGDTVMK